MWWKKYGLQYSHSLISLTQPLPLLLPLPLPSCEMFAMSSQSLTKLARLTDFTILELETPSYTTANQYLCLQLTPPREDVENKSQPFLSPPQTPLRLEWCFLECSLCIKFCWYDAALKIWFAKWIRMLHQIGRIGGKGNRAESLHTSILLRWLFCIWRSSDF